MATKRKKKAAKKPLSKRALRLLAIKRSKAAFNGWKTRRAREAPEKIAKRHKALTNKKREIREKKNSGIYDAAEKASDRARIKDLEAEIAALKEQVAARFDGKYDTSLFVNVLPPPWLNEKTFTIATSRCRIRHSDESDAIQEEFAEKYEDGGEQAVFKFARQLLAHYEDNHEGLDWDWWTDEDPLTFQELISLYFSP